MSKKASQAFDFAAARSLRTWALIRSAAADRSASVAFLSQGRDGFRSSVCIWGGTSGLSCWMYASRSASVRGVSTCARLFALPKTTAQGKKNATSTSKMTNSRATT